MAADPPPALYDELRRANDSNRHWIPVAVLAFLLLVAYAWTDWMSDYPPPGYEAVSEHRVLGKLFSSDDHLANKVWMHDKSDESNHDQRRMLLMLAAVGFLLAYYLPVQYKRQPLAILTCFGVEWLLGYQALAMFLAWHMLAYLTFHAPTPRQPAARACLAVLSVCLTVPDSTLDAAIVAQWLLWSILSFPLLYVSYHYLYFPLLNTRATHWLRPCIAHSTLIYIAIAATWNSQSSDQFFHPVGWLLFFWQWERLVMYHIDLKDRRVPADLSVMLYLATFLSPATFSNFHWLSRIPLGYAYLNNAFLARDKNTIVLSGVWLMSLAVFFFSVRPLVLKLFRMGMSALGLDDDVVRYGHLADLLGTGDDPGIVAVWCVLIYAFLSFYLLWTAVAHLKVGLWRLFGYDIEPYFQKPFMATNLVELWKRYSYYYREFLLQAFYYPVFLRFFRSSPRLRIFTATFAAAGFGNLIYHLVYATLYRGAEQQVITEVLTTIPYYVLLGTGIAITQVWLVARGRKRRKPWSKGWRTLLDILAVVGTFGFFILIRPFHHVPKDDSLMEAVRMVMAALGVAV